jgi:DNA-binding Lrp family transcriptional regulator
MIPWLPEPGNIMSVHLDDADRLIIKSLRENARMPNAELARRVGLSEAQCLRRLHALEDQGTIRQYRPVIDLNAVGLSVMAFVELRVDCPTASRVASFERAIDAREEVTECWRINGDTDYLLKASVTDLVAYERFLTGGFVEPTGVSVVRSHLALRNVKASTANLQLAPGRTIMTNSRPRRVISKSASPESQARAVAEQQRTVSSRQRNGSEASVGTVDLDDIDFRILHALSANARVSNVDLAARVGLSPAACLRRVRALEARRVIRYYITLVDYATFDMFVVFMKLQMDRRTREWQEAFERAIVELPSVVEAYRTEGESDYVMRGIVTGFDGLEHLLSAPLLIRPGVKAVQSAIGLRACVIGVEKLTGVAGVQDSMVK